MRTHYRSTVLFSEPAIEEAGIGLDSFHRLFKRYTRVTGNDFYSLEPPAMRSIAAARGLAAPSHEKFLAAMDDDFNTGGDIGELFELARLANKYCDDHDLEGAGKSNAAAVAEFTTLLTTLKELSNILGIFTAPPTATGGGELLSQAMQVVIDLRAESRARKTSPWPTPSATRSNPSPSPSKTAPAAPSGPAAPTTQWTA